MYVYQLSISMPYFMFCWQFHYISDGYKNYLVSGTLMFSLIYHASYKMLIPKVNQVLFHSSNRLKSLKGLKNRMVKFGGSFHPEPLAFLKHFWRFADYFWILFLGSDSNSWCHLGLLLSTSFSDPEFQLPSLKK